MHMILLELAIRVRCTRVNIKPNSSVLAQANNAEWAPSLVDADG